MLLRCPACSVVARIPGCIMIQQIYWQPYHVGWPTLRAPIVVANPWQICPRISRPISCRHGCGWMCCWGQVPLNLSGCVHSSPCSAAAPAFLSSVAMRRVADCCGFGETPCTHRTLAAWVWACSWHWRGSCSTESVCVCVRAVVAVFICKSPPIAWSSLLPGGSPLLQAYCLLIAALFVGGALLAELHYHVKLNVWPSVVLTV